MSENDENADFKYPVSKVINSNCLFNVTSSLKLKAMQFRGETINRLLNRSVNKKLLTILININFTVKNVKHSLN